MKTKNKLKFSILRNVILFFVVGYFSLNAKAEILDYLHSNAKEIILIIGETKPLSVKNPRQVKIGNPKFLDVVGAGRKELLLSGLAEGETSLTVVDDLGQRNYTVKIFQEDLEKLKERIDVLLEMAGFTKLTTKIGAQERKVFVIGKCPVSKKDSFESRIESIKDRIINLAEFYEDVPSIEIDVEILEIGKTALDTLGFAWDKSVALTNARMTDFMSPTHALKVLKSPFDQDNWEVTLNFLKQRNQARTLSRPKIVCLSGKEAKLVVGGQRPYIMGTTTTVTQGAAVTEVAIELKDYGLTLSIRPIAKENDEVQVSLTAEIKEIDESTTITVAGVENPGFTTRTTQTELTVMNGHTVFLAGLIKSKLTDERDGIAGLSNIPFFGALFRNKDYSKIDTEIVITLTPTIIRNEPSENISPIITAKDTMLSPQTLSGEMRKVAQETPAVIEEDNSVAKYSSLIQNIINSNIKYPQELKSARVEGDVKLSLHLTSSGKLLGVIIMKSSSSQLLDEAAEYTVKKLSPYPAFPSDVKLKELWVEIPIVYRTESGI